MRSVSIVAVTVCVIVMIITMIGIYGIFGIFNQFNGFNLAESAASFGRKSACKTVRVRGRLASDVNRAKRALRQWATARRRNNKTETFGPRRHAISASVTVCPNARPGQLFKAIGLAQAQLDAVINTTGSHTPTQQNNATITIPTQQNNATGTIPIPIPVTVTNTLPTQQNNATVPTDTVPPQQNNATVPTTIPPRQYNLPDWDSDGSYVPKTTLPQRECVSGCCKSVTVYGSNYMDAENASNALKAWAAAVRAGQQRDSRDMNFGDINLRPINTVKVCANYELEGDSLLQRVDDAINTLMAPSMMIYKSKI